MSAIGASAADDARSIESSEAGLPAYRVLPCPKGCADGTPAIPIRRVPPLAQVLPTPDNWYAEAVVEIHYTVGIDGRTKDVTLMRVDGSPSFAGRTMDAVRQWTFKPATVQGRTVEAAYSVAYQFRVPWEHGARPQVRRLFDAAREDMAAGKFDSAVALLQRARRVGRLNLYELVMISFGMAVALNQKQQYDDAVGEIRTALLKGGAFLDPKAIEPAMRLSLALEARAGNFAAALAMASMLRKLEVSDPAIDTIEASVRSVIAQPRPLAVSAVIPDTQFAGAWRHTLFRRTFAFDTINGNVQRFQLSCDQRAIESPVKSGVQWHVPPTWSNCDLYVFGTPGATFRLIEYK
jgi:hypothetical protein